MYGQFIRAFPQADGSVERSLLGAECVFEGSGKKVGCVEFSHSEHLRSQWLWMGVEHRSGVCVPPSLLVLMDRAPVLVDG